MKVLARKALAGEVSAKIAVVLFAVGLVGCTGGEGGGKVDVLASAEAADTAADTAAIAPAVNPSSCGYLQDFFVELLGLTNAAREAAGLQPLSFSLQLGQSAQRYAETLATQNFFSHTGLDGYTVGQRVLDQGYLFSVAGENLAAGFTTPQSAFNGWMNSPAHRSNVLRPEFVEVGFGFFYHPDSTYGSYWVQNFAAPLGGAVSSAPSAYLSATCSVTPPKGASPSSVAGVFTQARTQQPVTSRAAQAESVPEPDAALGLLGAIAPLLWLRRR